MSSTRRVFACLLLLAASAAAHAGDVQGTLMLRWGDPLAGAQAERLQASIEAQDGRVYGLDTAQAEADGIALHDLAGRDVVARLDARQKSGAGLRLAALAAKDGTDPAPVADSRPWMNLLCKFADKSAEPTTRARIDAAFAPGGASTTCWQTTSQGFIDLGNSRSLGWVTMAAPHASYVDANGNPNLQKLLNDCVAAAGEALVQATAAEDFAGINVLVNESLGCCAWGGNARATIGGNTKTWRVTWVPPSAYLNISLFAHELGHAFGMPHSNNSDGDSNTYDNPWDLLSDSSGHAVTASGWGTLPKTPSGYHLDRAGWLDASEKRVIDADDERVVLQRLDRPAEGAVRLLKIRLPQYEGGRYYTVEARVRQGAEYDARLPDDGVVIYEVDPRRAQPAWLVDSSTPAANYSNTRGVVFKPGDRWTAPDGSFTLAVSGAQDGFAVDVQLAQGSFDSGFE